jgi:hypothetical protein
MKYLILILFLNNLYADDKFIEVETTDDDLIYLSNGEVRFKHKSTNLKGEKKEKINHQNKISFSNYKPSILTNIVQAFDIFKRMRNDHYEDAQCTNIAHVWAYEEFKRSGLKSEKIFLFFSKKYIKRYRFGWWFHVSPIVNMSEDNLIQNIVLDRGYTTMPFEIKTWTDHFIKSKKECKFIDKISTYYKNKSNEDCFIMKVSMYYWKPRDIRLRDQTGNEKKIFYKSEIKKAYQEAFFRR